MKKLLKLATSITAVLALVFSLTGCFLEDLGIGSSLKRQSINAETITTLRENIQSTTLPNSSNLKFEASYDYEYNSTNQYVYTTKYEVDMKVNGEANVGEVFAYIEFDTEYSQQDGTHGRDLLIKYCIVRVGAGDSYNDYKVYMNLGGQTYSGTFYQIIATLEDIEENGSDLYFSGTRHNYDMLDVLDYSDNANFYDDYFGTLYDFATAMYGNYVVSTTDNPFIHCLHYFNLDGFIRTLNNLDENSKGYTLYASDNAYRVKRSYVDSRYFREEYKLDDKLTVHEDGTYTFESEYKYSTANPARAHQTEIEQELKPLTGTIQIPSWAN